MSMLRIALIGLFFALGVASHAYAVTGYGHQATKSWQSEDKCARQAQQAFPDPDAASQARRTQAIRQCLMQNGLATRGATVPTPKVPGAGGTP